MIYKPGVVARVPFPFVESGQTKHRPALVLSSVAFNANHGMAVMAMITSAKHRRWPTDVAIADLAAAGLPDASVVRFKLFTLDLRLTAGVLGRLGAKDWRAVRAAIEEILPHAKAA